MIVRAGYLIALLLLAHAVSAAELGRVFFTPAQRATLDNARKQNIRAEISNDAEQPAVPLPQNVSVNGVIRRSDGKNTIWLNNRVVGDHQAAGLSATLGRNDNRVRLSVAESGRNIDLKVGQTVEIVSGTIGESYLRRPATKLDVKTLPATAPDGTSAPKDAPPQAATPVAVDRGIQRDSTRAAPVDAKLNNGIGQK